MCVEDEDFTCEEKIENALIAATETCKSHGKRFENVMGSLGFDFDGVAIDRCLEKEIIEDFFSFLQSNNVDNYQHLYLELPGYLNRNR